MDVSCSTHGRDEKHWVGKAEGKCVLWDNIKMDLRIGREGVDYINLDRDMAINLRVPKK
jgi:hypothetical protein